MFISRKGRERKRHAGVPLREGDSVFNVARFLTPVLFSLTLILAAFVIAFIIVNHALALFLTRIPAGILTRIPRFTALMRLFGGLRHVNTTTGKQHQPGSNSKIGFHS